ncbi:fasciclin domain-containing protein [Salinibacter ruber]|uniref:fasciclin domain-containing protein n=1 Tax=Salinibacter ruber TaxID=146919 RepID=UPI0020736D24|nr:fasciclin domain-containing protein [Salinibacter ruber]
MGLFAFALVLAGCDSDGSGMEEPSNTLTQVVSNNNDLSTLASALQAADLAETLGNENATFTVFAPANPAFDNVDVQSLTDNPDLLRDLLNFHVVQGEALTASDLQGRESVTTVEGQELQIGSENGTLTVGGVPVSQSDVEASNGVAHVIGGVLIPESFPRRVSYDLAAQSNSGVISSGVEGTVTFWEYNDSQTLVTLSLDNGPTGESVSHPAHIHNGNASEGGGGIEIYLSPLDGTNTENDANDGTSARLVNRSFDNLAGFNGYVNIHESVDNPVVVAQGNIGANATGTLGAGLSLVDNPTMNTKELTAQPNEGAFSNGVPGQLRLRELTADQTLVTVRLDPDDDNNFEEGPTQGSLQEATVSHPAHIHGSGGAIQDYLSPVDGSDPRARSSQIVPNSVLNSDGIYVNVHESAAKLVNIVSQGDVGSSSGGSGGY